MINAGDHTTIDQTVEEYFGSETYVGKYSSLAEGVILCGSMNHVCTTHKKAVSTFPFTSQFNVDYFERSVSRGPIHIGNDTWIGRDAMIMDGVHIGNGCIIGARSVVTKDVPDYAVVAGNPGTVKLYRFSYETIQRLLKIKWWEWDKQTVIDRIEDFKDIDVFIDKYYRE